MIILSVLVPSCVIVCQCMTLFGKDLHKFIHLNLKQFLKNSLKNCSMIYRTSPKMTLFIFDSKLMKMASSIVVKYICCLVNSSLVKCTVLNGW